MPNNKQIIIWLYACAFMVFAMAVIGAATRLTESGLSMVEWRPLMGMLPPLSEAEWQRVYELYKQSPEFLHKHSWMELGDFKNIFFWEWFHRFWGRAIGLVYGLPLLWFFIRKQIPKGFGWKFIGMLLLGGGQGLLGWYMVKSGLVDNPDVSHYRLAAHLSLALLIFSALIWTAMDLQRPAIEKPKNTNLTIHGLVTLALLAITIIWGAFVAGLDAGMIYNSFPLMNGSFLPPETYKSHGIFEQHSWVQFTHRWLAITTLLVVLCLAWRVKDIALAIMGMAQILLGISTLISGVVIPLAALHQAGAIILLALVLRTLHRSRL